jgi:Beta-lactamase
MSTGGLSRARLERMQDVMAGHVDRGVVPGMVTLVSRRGEIQVDAIGTKAFGDSDPMRRDSIFRVASVTKPIVAAAAMILVEECALRLDEPVDQWLPELAGVQLLPRLLGQPRLGIRRLHRDPARRPGGNPRTLRLGWWLRHVVVRGPREGIDRDPDDPTRVGCLRCSGRPTRFLDLGLRGDRRLRLLIAQATVVASDH